MQIRADFFEREAGHVVVCLVLIVMSAGLWLLGVPKGADLIPFALGVLGRSMIGRRPAPEEDYEK